jgi:hypothetical protein
VNRWRLAIIGTVAVGATILVAWILLLPYTLGQPTTSTFIDSVRQRWAESRSTIPVVTPLPLAEGRAQAVRQLGQRVAIDPDRRFALVVPEQWVDASVASGSYNFVVGSTTISFAYPAAVTEALGDITTSTLMDGQPAVRSASNERVQVVAQLSSGYAVLAAVGPEAAARSDELLVGVYLNK